jgi:hypothetical protein
MWLLIRFSRSEQYYKDMVKFDETQRISLVSFIFNVIQTACAWGMFMKETEYKASGAI